MLTPSPTYRTFLLGLLMFSYAFSIFQKPLFEVAHLISHAQDFAFAQEKIHTYHTHDGSSHNHANISLLEESLNDEEQPQSSKKKLDAKKKVELVNSAGLHQQMKEPLGIANFLVTQHLSIYFIKKPSPPPRLG